MVRKSDVVSKELSFTLQKDISVAFFRVGMLGFGGGPSAIPLFHKEVVSKYKWMKDEEFSDVLAIANTMPGPIATKMAGYIGYRVAGIIGCINALLSSILPTILFMIIILTYLQNYKDLPIVQGMVSAVVPIVAVMLGTMTWDFIKNTKDSFGWGKALILLLSTVILTEVLGIHPAIIIAICIIIAFVPSIKGRFSK